MAKKPDPPAPAPRQGFLLYPWQRAAWARLWQARQQGRLPHALLITGAPGMGKAQLARNLGQAILCQTPDPDGRPCGTCKGCHLFAIGHHPDFRVLGPDPEAKSDEIKVDDVRDQIAAQDLSAHQGATKLLVIDPAERMNRHAANGLLKTLEEPAPSTLLVLVSARPAALLPTIRSRCQTLYLAPPPEAEAHTWLQGQGLTGDPRVPLRLASGAPLAALRLAQSELLARRDQAWQAFVALGQGQGQLVRTAETWSQWDLSILLGWMMGWIADLARLGTGHPAPWLVNPDRQAELEPLARRLDPAALHRYWRELATAGDRLRANLIPQLLLESLLIRWTQIAAGR